MISKSCKYILLLIGVIASVANCAMAEISPERLAIAKETEDYAATTANEKVTPEIVMEKVDKAAKMLEAEGLEAGIAKMQGKGSEYIFGGTYIWINDLDIQMVFHPIKPGLEGKNLVSLKDVKGRSFFSKLTKLAREKGSGWVSYYWPKPGEKEASLKVSYSKLVDINGTKYVLACGIYDVSPEKIAELEVLTSSDRRSLAVL